MKASVHQSLEPIPIQSRKFRHPKIHEAEIYEKALSWLLTRLLWGVTAKLH